MQAVMMHVLYMLYVGNYNAPVLGRIDKLNEKGAQAENPLPPRRTNIVSKKYRYLRTAPKCEPVNSIQLSTKCEPVNSIQLSTK